ncbi:MAG: ZIP family metal transporter [Thermoplasmatota archaeon]
MDPAWLPTLGSVAAVSLLSFLGAAYLLVGILRHHYVLLGMVALAVGALLGDAFLHILPESTAAWGGFSATMGLAVLAGFLPFFLLESVLRSRHTHSIPHAADETAHLGHPEPHVHAQARPALFGWMNLAGSALHNALDGAVIAAAFLADRGLGVATAIAVGLHEIPHEFGDVAVLIKGGFPLRRALLFNFLSALLALAGALAILVLPIPHAAISLYALPITAGGFLYIAAADLVPELHHHTGDRRHVALILMGLVGGLALMAALLRLES